MKSVRSQVLVIDNGQMQRILRSRFRMALESALIVLVLLGIQLLLETADLNRLAYNNLYSSIVSGGLFVIGFLVAGTLNDYKESERMPAELAGSIESINEDCRSIAADHPDFDIAGLRAQLRKIIESFRSDVVDHKRNCMDAVRGLSDYFIALERAGVPANYIVRLRAEQSTIRRVVMRMYHIQRINFLPSARTLIQCITAGIVLLMMFTRFDSAIQTSVVMALVSFFLVYLQRLVAILDEPFHINGKSKDDVSLFLMSETHARLLKDDQDAGASAPVAR